MQAAPYLHPKLVVTDSRVHHTYGERGDAELVQELIAVEQRLQLTQTITGEVI